MAVFTIALLRVIDHARFRQYDQALRAVLPRFGGEIIVSSGDMTCFAGEPDINHVVVTRFVSEAEVRRYLESPEYQMISVLREAGAAITAMILRDSSVRDAVATATGPANLAPAPLPDGSVA